MEKIPTEIMKIIIAGIDREMIVAAVLVCKEWRDIVSLLYANRQPIATLGRIARKYGPDYYLSFMGESDNSRLYKFPADVFDGHFWVTIDGDNFARALVRNDRKLALEFSRTRNTNKLIEYYNHMLYAFTVEGDYEAVAGLLSANNYDKLRAKKHAGFIRGYFRKRLWNEPRWERLMMSALTFPHADNEIFQCFQDVYKYITRLPNYCEIICKLVVKKRCSTGQIAHIDKYKLSYFYLAATLAGDMEKMVEIHNFGICLGLSTSSLNAYHNGAICQLIYTRNEGPRNFAVPEFATPFTVLSLLVIEHKGDCKPVFRFARRIQVGSDAFMARFTPYIIKFIDNVERICKKHPFPLVEYGINFGYLDPVKDRLLAALEHSKYDLRKRMAAMERRD